MHCYIALLRGINVGGRRVKMDDLREHFTDVGHHHVWTFLGSGNVGFSSECDDRAAIARDIEHHLARVLGFEVATFLRTADDLNRVVAFDPPVPVGWDPGAASHYVIFLTDAAPKSVTAALEEVQSDCDRFVIQGREVHWLTRGKLSESPLFGTDIERATRGVHTTTRNMSSLRRLATKATAEAASRIV